jgi:hypothetical protein
MSYLPLPLHSLPFGSLQTLLARLKLLHVRVFKRRICLPLLKLRGYAVLPFFAALGTITTLSNLFVNPFENEVKILPAPCQVYNEPMPWVLILNTSHADLSTNHYLCVVVRVLYRCALLSGVKATVFKNNTKLA